MESSSLILDVAYCGLYCATCGAAREGRCEGCRAGGGFAGCRVRLCAEERGFVTCAECQEMESCEKLNSFLSRLYTLLTRSRRLDNLREIRDSGLEAFLVKKAEAQRR